MLDKMPNYSGFLNQLTNFVFIPIFAAFCLYQYSQGKLSQEVLRFPKKNFALMGCLDGLCGIMAVVGGTAQVVLSQLGIPVMLLLCWLMLGKKYNAIQHLGAAVIIMGVLVVESPGLLHPNKEDSNNVPFFNLLFLLSILPSSLSYVVKEIAFRGVQMNTSFLQFWVALFQFFVGFILLPVTSLPLLGREVVPLAELWTRLINGGKCLFGISIIVPPECGPVWGVPCDFCEGAWVEVLVYVLFNLIYNVCSMLVLKHCGATVLFLIMTVRLPLTSMAFYSKLIVMHEAKTL
ncbi:drug metabolite transporter superfamily related protein [Cyclospora cayetanensis]|uniref:Drug metabolite transporter superfamily related protein n=1 Tax=Cyclospora cayetanensis TaxID=88456 RepID=A0A1D3D4K4_9EIME|nr:drug metabolite transporter superfamily related protein [Cyclospora cayetanensis]